MYRVSVVGGVARVAFDLIEYDRLDIYCLWCRLGLAILLTVAFFSSN